MEREERVRMKFGEKKSYREGKVDSQEGSGREREGKRNRMKGRIGREKNSDGVVLLRAQFINLSSVLINISFSFQCFKS